MSDVYLSSDAATHIPGCDTNCFGAATCRGSAEPMPGWWAQWCVTHDSSLYEFGERVGDVCDDSRSGAAGFCRWHPLGAFIPEVDDDE